MTNLKINSTSTPYWCVVVPVDAENLHIYKTAPALEFEMYGIEYGICLPVGNYSILGCITSSGMDEGVREMVQFIHIPTAPAVIYRNYVNDEHFILWQNSVKSLLEHNQITLTADQKAVVIKQK